MGPPGLPCVDAAPRDVPQWSATPSSIACNVVQYRADNSIDGPIERKHKATRGSSLLSTQQNHGHPTGSVERDTLDNREVLLASPLSGSDKHTQRVPYRPHVRKARSHKCEWLRQ